MNRSSTLASIIILLIVTACATTKLPAKHLYTLDINMAGKDNTGKSSTGKTLSVDTPKSSAAIMSRNILYQDKSHSLNAYAFSQWSDTPNRMLANLLLTELADSKIFKVVLPVDSRAKSDYVLESTIHQFHQQLGSGGKSSVRVRIVFYLLERSTAKVVSSREFFEDLETGSVDAKGGVDGFNKAVKSICARMIAWLSSIEL